MRSDRIAQELDEMVLVFATAADRAGQLGAELAAACRTEAEEYEAAFAGGLAAVGVVGSVSAGVGAQGTVQASGPDISVVGGPLGLTPEESRTAVQDALEAGDNVPGLGKDRLNSGFEDQLLRRWLDGAGGTYELTPAELGAVTNAAIVQQVGTAIVNHQGATNARGDQIDIREVTLANGQPGYAAGLDFYDPMPGGQVNTLDGSFGGATVYYNSRGEAVGIRDRYDFTNDNVQVHLTNFAGSLVGAKDYDLRGGITER